MCIFKEAGKLKVPLKISPFLFTSLLSFKYVKSGQSLIQCFFFFFLPNLKPQKWEQIKTTQVSVLNENLIFHHILYNMDFDHDVIEYP